MRPLRFLLSLLAPVLLGPSAQADEVHLNGGTILRGQVLQVASATESEEKPPVHLLLDGGDVLEIRAADVKRVKRSEDAPASGEHLRYVAPKKAPDDGEPGGSEPGGLDVSVTYYVHPEGGPRVDLVSAVHIGEATYYRAAQRLLDRAGVVLYEGVKPKDSTPAEFEAPQSEEENPLRAMQGKIARWFGLVFQLDAIDYTRPHFVHADMTMEEFAGRPAAPTSPEGEADRAPSTGESPGGELQGRVKRLMSIIKVFGPMLDLAMGNDESAGPLRRRLKGTFARMLGSIDVQNALKGMGPEFNDLLLTKRNAVVIERLKEQRAKPGLKSIAVFYGAAHMTGLETDLVRLGYKRAGAEWLRAWDVK